MEQNSQTGLESKSTAKKPTYRERKGSRFNYILLLLKVPPSQRSTIVLISGDRDMRPTVEGILEEAVGWKIEICMWERNISQGLKELDGKYEHLSILPLDEHWDEVVYTENVAPPNTDPNSSIVLTVTRGKFSKGDRIDLTQPLWWDTLEQLCTWPVQYKWIEDQNNEARQLLLWFKGLKENKTRILAEKLKENKSRLLHVERCEMYTAFKERYERGPSKQVSDEEGWTEVVKKPKPARTTGRATTVCEPPRPVTRKQLCAPLLCCLGQNCEDGSNCKYSHNEDNEYFKRRKGKGNRYRKTSMCTQYPRCKSSTIRCDFAHEESDRWCLKCHTQGHFQRDCKNTKCTHPRHTTTT